MSAIMVADIFLRRVAAVPASRMGFVAFFGQDKSLPASLSEETTIRFVIVQPMVLRMLCRRYARICGIDRALLSRVVSSTAVRGCFDVAG